MDDFPCVSLTGPDTGISAPSQKSATMDIHIPSDKLPNVQSQLNFKSATLPLSSTENIVATNVMDDFFYVSLTGSDTVIPVPSSAPADSYISSQEKVPIDAGSTVRVFFIQKILTNGLQYSCFDVVHAKFLRPRAPLGSVDINVALGPNQVSLSCVETIPARAPTRRKPVPKYSLELEVKDKLLSPAQWFTSGMKALAPPPRRKAQGRSHVSTGA